MVLLVRLVGRKMIGAKKGFTLVELLLVIGIFAILATLSSLSFFTTVSRSSLTAARDVLVADLKTAQSSAMSGEGQNGATTGGWGIVVNNATTYTLFPGTTYDSNNPLNATTTLPSDTTLTTNFPNSQVVFLHGSGEIDNFNAAQNTLTLSGSNSTSTIRLNLYGTVIGD